MLSTARIPRKERCGWGRMTDLCLGHVGVESLVHDLSDPEVSA